MAILSNFDDKELMKSEAHGLPRLAKPSVFGYPSDRQDVVACAFLMHKSTCQPSWDVRSRKKNCEIVLRV